MVYLDNAATSGIKPESVYTAVDHALRCCSGNPGRSGHSLSVAAGRIVEDARIALAGFFGAQDPSEICFTGNATAALNTAILGTVNPGDHIITSSLEHNSVSRPLEYLKTLDCSLSVLPASVETGVDPEDVRRAVRGNTSLVVINHISNVTGTVNDICAIGEICRSYGITFLADAAQSAGSADIDVRKCQIDMLAFPGHKGLLGPQGTGGLYVRKDIPIRPLIRGGTGSFSEQLTQPTERPGALESGTLNVPGIAGLAAGAAFIREVGIRNIHDKEQRLRLRILHGLKEIPGVRLYSPSEQADAGSVISFTMEGFEPSDIAMMLDASFGIAVRSGLHCAPYAHNMLGTISSGGTVRVSPGFFTTDEEIDIFTDAIRELSKI